VITATLHSSRDPAHDAKKMYTDSQHTYLRLVLSGDSQPKPNRKRNLNLTLTLNLNLTLTVTLITRLL